MIETDKQQEKRRGITPRLTPNTPHLPKNPYGKTSYPCGFFVCANNRRICWRKLTNIFVKTVEYFYKLPKVCGDREKSLRLFENSQSYSEKPSEFRNVRLCDLLDDYHNFLYNNFIKRNYSGMFCCLNDIVLIAEKLWAYKRR